MAQARKIEVSIPMEVYAITCEKCTVTFAYFYIIEYIDDLHQEKVDFLPLVLCSHCPFCGAKQGSQYKQGATVEGH